MQDREKQRELLKETRTAERVLELAINTEMGIQNQSKISGTAAYSVSNQVAYTSIYSFKAPGIDLNQQRLISPNLQFANCGYAWSASHRQNCPKPGKNCKS